jgi:hypothetical protein
MSDRDARQLRQMQSQIELFRLQQIPLKGLADGLEFLLSHVEDAESSWRQALLSRLGVLEDIYATALDKSGGTLGETDRHRISSAVVSISELIGSQLEKSESER